MITLLSMPAGMEWVVIALVVLLLFGGKKIPELMRGLGKGVRSFKDGLSEASDEFRRGIDDDADSADSSKNSSKS